MPWLATSAWYRWLHWVGLSWSQLASSKLTPRQIAITNVTSHYTACITAISRSSSHLIYGFFVHVSNHFPQHASTSGFLEPLLDMYISDWYVNMTLITDNVKLCTNYTLYPCRMSWPQPLTTKITTAMNNWPSRLSAHCEIYPTKELPTNMCRQSGVSL